MTTSKVLRAMGQFRSATGTLETIVLAVLLMVILATVGQTEEIEAVVSIPPLAYLVEQVGGQYVNVEILLEPGQSPVTFDPYPREMISLGNADLLFTVGVPFEERLLERIESAFRDLRVVATQEGIQLRPISHSHGEGDEKHGTLDPHIWLDPELAKLQAAAICRGLSDVLPAYTVQFQRNLLQLRSKLDSVDQVITNMLSPYAGSAIGVFHPSFGYFGDAYGLEQIAIETDGKEPGARQMVAVMERLQENNIATIYVMPQFARKSAEVIAEQIGGRVETLDPLAVDYTDNLVRMASRIQQDLKSRNRPQPGNAEDDG